MITLSNAQCRTLENTADSNGKGSPFIPPTGARGRPAKYLKKFGLIVERDGVENQFWITEHGHAALARVKGRSPA